MNYKAVSKETYNKLLKMKTADEIIRELIPLSVSNLEDALILSMLKWKILSESNALSYIETKNLATCMESCGLCRLVNKGEYNPYDEKTFGDTDHMECTCSECHENTGFEKELYEERELYDGPHQDPDEICFKALFDYVEVMKEDFYTHKHKVKASAYLIRNMMHSKLKEIQQG